MIHIAISDLHLGSRHTCYDKLRRFLACVPTDCELILNGDTIDDPTSPLPPYADNVVGELAELSHHIRSLVWLEGNHDGFSMPPALAHLPQKKSYTIAGRIHFEHGHLADSVMPRHRWFIWSFHMLHKLRIVLGASPVHVAEYAKEWPFLYRILRRSVENNAIELARRKGVSSVACGHVHYAEKEHVNGIDYYNTGCWTEEISCYYLVVDEANIRLVKYHPGDPVPAPPS